MSAIAAEVAVRINAGGGPSPALVNVYCHCIRCVLQCNVNDIRSSSIIIIIIIIVIISIIISVDIFKGV